MLSNLHQQKPDIEIPFPDDLRSEGAEEPAAAAPDVRMQPETMMKKEQYFITKALKD